MSDLKTIRVRVEYIVDVTLDADKFDDAFLQEFQGDFYPFQDINDHAEHIAQLHVREMLDDFTEGYGPIKDMGISAKTVEAREEWLHVFKDADA